MGAIAVNNGALSDPAYYALNGLEAINVAIARAEVAILHMLTGNTDALRHFIALKQAQITSLKAIMGFFSGFRRWVVHNKALLSCMAAMRHWVCCQINSPFQYTFLKRCSRTEWFSFSQ